MELVMCVSVLYTRCAATDFWNEGCSRGGGVNGGGGVTSAVGLRKWQNCVL